MICNKCGSQVKDGNSFCPSCGNKLASEQSSFNNNGYNANQQNTQNSYNQNSYNQNSYNTNQQYNQGGYNQNQQFSQSGYNQGGYNQNQQFNPNGYNQGGFQPRTPINERNIVMCIILSIVTCGIYGIFWYISLVDDLNVAADEPNTTSGGMVFLLGLVTCGIYTLYWMYKAGELVNAAKYKRGLQTDPNSGILYLVLTLFGLGIVSYCLIQNELNQMSHM